MVRCQTRRRRPLTVEILTEILREYGALGAVVALVITNVVALFWLLANGTLEFGSRRRAEVAYLTEQIRINAEYLTEQIRINKEGYEARIAEQRQDIEDLQKDRDFWRDKGLRATVAGEVIAKNVTPPHGTRRPDLLG